MNLADRAFRTEAVLAQYRDRAFDWKRAHCILLAQSQATAMGHPVPPVPRIRSALGAKRALQKQGVESVTELLDKYLPRHAAPAFMLVGDLCALPGERDGGGLEAVGIADGQGNIFAWHDDRPNGLAVIKFAHADIMAAWRL